MAAKIEETEESEMNMTPMIDIVFQLIIFFLLSLKFKTVEQRIESQLPKDRGIQATPQFVDELPLLTVKLFRKNPGDEAKQFTKIRVGQDITINLPEGVWPERGREEFEFQKRYETAFHKVKLAIVQLWEKMGRNPDVKGEIKTPPPGKDERTGAMLGSLVPHGDVVKVLDSYLQAGIYDVKFEGAAPPLPGSGGRVGTTGN